MNATDDLTQSLIAQRAAEWFIAHRGGELSSAERAAFVEWLKASPEHVREYLLVAGVSREVASAARSIDLGLETLIQDAAGDSGADVIPMPRWAPGIDRAFAAADGQPATKPRPRMAWLRALAASLVILAVAAAAFWRLHDGERFGIPRTYRTAHAEQSTWRLPDGSVMHLNTDTQVSVKFSAGERRIEIDRGQAHFSVIHDPARRFRVMAGQTEVVAIGTEFDVYRRTRDTVVTVVQGRVAVLPRSPSPPMTSDVPRPDGTARIDESFRSVELAAGQQIRISNDAERAEPVMANLHESTAWLQRQIVFEQRPLGEVASEFNRYSRVPIEIDDPNLATLRISGVFNAYDTESFIGFLSRMNGVTVEAGPQRIRVRSRSETRQH